MFQFLAAAVILMCETTIKEGKKFISLCYKLAEEPMMEPVVRRELYFLAEKSKPFIPVFIAGTSKVSTALILKIVGFTTTYLIAMLQFNAAL